VLGSCLKSGENIARKLRIVLSPQEELARKIRERLDLVDLISSHLPLKQVDQDLIGNCPFHTDDALSFHVTPATQTWYCLGCQRGGDHFTFIQQLEHVDFLGAANILVKRAGRNQ
jgi:DNA primase